MERGAWGPAPTLSLAAEPITRNSDQSPPQSQRSGGSRAHRPPLLFDAQQLKASAAITIKETRDGTGYVVFVNQPDNPGLAGWIEFGTIKMTARGFLFTSARLEEGGHMRRLGEAVQAAINALGLGG